MKVQILSKKLIPPSSPTPLNLQNLKLSCFDQLAPPTYVPCIFYYPADGEDNAERSKKMEKSLAETLTLFYPLGGRYIEETLSIECNDKGAEYLEAQVSGSLSQHLEKEKIEIQNWSLLVPRLFQSETSSPLVAIQFNIFECGGLAIGTCVSHRIADAYTVATFINSWATACRIGIEKVQYCPSFEFGYLFPPKKLPSISSVGDFTGVRVIKKTVKKTLVFKGATISRLKEIATGCASNQVLIRYQPTRVEVVTGLIWMILIRVAQAIHGYLRPSVFGFSVNMRGKARISTIPEYACGNFLNMGIAQFVPDIDESKTELHDFVNRLHDSIRNTVESCSKASNGDDLLFIFAKKMGEGREAWRNGEIDAYMVTSWCRLPWYETDFGWGKPSWLHGIDVTNDSGVFTFFDTEDGDGIEVILSLDESSMLLFQQNLDLALTGN